MLLFKDGYFQKNGASFILPDGFYLETSPDAEVEGLIAWAPDKLMHIELGLDEEESDAKVSFEGYFEKGSDLDIRIRNTMEPTIVNGLKGYQAYYVSNEAAFVEYRLELPEGGTMWIMFEQKGVSPQELQKSVYLEAMLEEIRKSATE